MSKHPFEKARREVGKMNALGRVQFITMLIDDVFACPPMEWANGNRLPTRDDTAKRLIAEVVARRDQFLTRGK